MRGQILQSNSIRHSFFQYWINQCMNTYDHHYLLERCDFSNISAFTYSLDI